MKRTIEIDDTLGEIVESDNGGEMKTKTGIKLLSRKKSEAFGKDTYLLGKVNEEYCWLEAARLDCGWYWGFGYIEVYTNPMHPSAARDITSHSHFSGFVGLKSEFYDTAKGCFRQSTDYIHHWNETPGLTESVLTDSESWQLSDLMRSYYTLKDAASVYHQGNSHLTTVESLDLSNNAMAKEINTNSIPAIIKAVYELLTPKD